MTNVQDKFDLQAIDVGTICRACLAQSDNLENIFKFFTAEMFDFCTSVKISESDGMPSSLCQQCFWLLNRVYYFKQLVLRSDTLMKEGIQVKVQSDAIEVGVTTANLSVNNLEDNESNSLLLSEQAVNNDHTYSNMVDTAIPSCQKIIQNQICVLPLQITKTQHTEKKMAFKCPKCGKATHNFEKLALHLNMHLDEKVVKLKKVKSVKPQKPLNYTCEVCGVTLRSAYNYKYHLKRHTGIKNIPCPICGKCFVLKFDLNNHIKTHINLRFYNCDICGRSLKTKVGLQIHYRSHTGERPFECEFCHKRYKDAAALKVHRTIHTGERRHKCEICDRKFAMKSLLHRHLKSHVPKFKKPTNSIKYHEMLFSAERPHECEICHRAFKRKCGLVRHMKIHNEHKVKQNDEMCENNNISQESNIDLVSIDEVVPNTEFPIYEQLQYAIMKVCSDINKAV